jgi:hypothetical protein
VWVFRVQRSRRKTHATCQSCMPEPHARATCQSHMPQSQARATCHSPQPQSEATCHMPQAHARATCQSHMPQATGHSQRPHATCHSQEADTHILNTFAHLGTHCRRDPAWNCGLPTTTTTTGRARSCHDAWHSRRRRHPRPLHCSGGHWCPLPSALSIRLPACPPANNVRSLWLSERCDGRPACKME